MTRTRRSFLTDSATLMAGAVVLPSAVRAAVADPAIKVGACVVGLDDAKKAGLAGVEVGVGGPADTLQIADPEHRSRLKADMARTGLPVCSLMMGLLNDCPLATDARGPAWLEQAIDAAADLGARVILIAFFGNGDLLDSAGQVKSTELNEVIKRLKTAAPRAQEKGVVLAIENYLTGRQNARILNAIDHPAVQLYYDIYNTGVSKGHDVPGDIRMLGPRIAQFHFKNGPDYLDKGNIDFPAIARAIREVDYRGWVVLETSSPSRNAVADARRNGEYVRGLFG